MTQVVTQNMQTERRPLPPRRLESELFPHKREVVSYVLRTYLVQDIYTVIPISPIYFIDDTIRSVDIVFLKEARFQGCRVTITSQRPIDLDLNESAPAISQEREQEQYAVNCRFLRPNMESGKETMLLLNEHSTKKEMSFPMTKDDFVQKNLVSSKDLEQSFFQETDSSLTSPMPGSVMWIDLSTGEWPVLEHDFRPSDTKFKEAGPLIFSWEMIFGEIPLQIPMIGYLILNQVLPVSQSSSPSQRISIMATLEFWIDRQDMTSATVDDYILTRDYESNTNEQFLFIPNLYALGKELYSKFHEDMVEFVQAGEGAFGTVTIEAVCSMVSLKCDATQKISVITYTPKSTSGLNELTIHDYPQTLEEIKQADAFGFVQTTEEWFTQSEFGKTQYEQDLIQGQQEDDKLIFSIPVLEKYISQGKGPYRVIEYQFTQENGQDTIKFSCHSIQSIDQVKDALFVPVDIINTPIVYPWTGNYSPEFSVLSPYAIKIDCKDATVPCQFSIDAKFSVRFTHN